ncbi:MAG: hypothetical protein CME59_16695 [Halioglobus sp.]|nr:hypothetical protein [Halioglobus sp.]|tara:strand:- start:1031 stop:1246 length:216 start_codon:yes stop_codon:yes gene_type:complete
MQFEITRPVFRCAEDEQIFLGRLQALPGLESVAGNDTHILLRLAPGAEAVVVAQLSEICALWHTRYAPVDA